MDDEKTGLNTMVFNPVFFDVRGVVMTEEIPL